MVAAWSSSYVESPVNGRYSALNQADIPRIALLRFPGSALNNVSIKDMKMNKKLVIQQQKLTENDLLFLWLYSALLDNPLSHVFMIQLFQDYR